MNEQLRDAYLAEVAGVARSAIQQLADGLKGGDPSAVASWGEVYPSLERLRDHLDTPGGRADLLNVVSEVLRVATHSQLVILDGGTALSDVGRQVFLTDDQGQLVADGLHEYLFDHLDDAAG